MRQTWPSQQSANLQQRAQNAGVTQDSVAKARQERQGMTPTERSADIQQRAQGAGITRESAAQTWQQHQGATPAAERSRELAGAQQRPASISGDTQRQLNRDASARRDGARSEQMRSRNPGGAGGFSGGGMRGGRRR